ncbi:hypothetical protein B0H13DRAFT_2262042 [Mycena leptocephala]|nr:hypothetical protein B0H13DRAFT_2262042 [Mycena leptocephala]
MKATSIFVFGALICSAAARPNPQRFGGSKGNQNKAGAKSTAIAASSAVAAPAVAASASAVASVSASGVASSVAASASAAAPSAAAPGAPVDLQSSLSLDPSVVCPNFVDDGQNPPVAGQSPSQTSTNNYINYCALTLPKTPLTNGLQITTGSCNPAPIGLIPSVDKMPSAKYLFPTNNSTITANTAFDAKLNVANFHTGVFTNAQKTYFAAPQTLDAQGLIIGHSHMVIETLTAIDQTTATDPTKFFFFKGVNDAAVGGVLTVTVTGGVPPGAYRICTINSSSNHQPVIVPIAQHGSLDDCTYFTAK